jgi:extracellular factor (EF) 3-hydroxypalmitic acid methyl ester biosynthesis protein
VITNSYYAGSSNTAVQNVNLANLAPTSFHLPASEQKHHELGIYAKELTESLDAALLLTTKHAMQLLRITLFNFHQAVDRQDWVRLVKEVVIPHPITKICHQDPFTARAFYKPRGYAGDAVMIDYVYGFHESFELDDTSLMVNSLTTNSPSTRAVRNRLNFIVNKLNTLCSAKLDCEVLSVASGHCREFGLTPALQSRSGGRFVAFDQDKDSIDLVNTEYASAGVTPVYGSVTTLLKNNGPEGQFDLVYALGLYDYLNQKFARRLTQNLFQRLRPGGEVIVANFMPDILDVGYMESCMGWELIFRDHDAMSDLAGNIDDAEIEERRIFLEPERNIIFLSLTKKST